MPTAGAIIYATYQVARVKTADETVNNSTTFQADNHLVTYSVLANKTYRFTFFGVFSSGATPDFKWRLVMPSGATARVSGRSRVGGTFATQDPGAAGGVVFAGDGADADFQATGYIVTSSTPGSVSLEWAQNTADASNTILRQGTELTVTEVG